MSPVVHEFFGRFGFRPADLDRQLLWPCVALLAVGLLMVASASTALADQQLSNSLHYFYRQSIFAVIGLTGACAMLLVPMEMWERSSFLLLALALLLLAIVLFPGIGREVNGARRWLNLGAFQLQASEPARLALFMYLAAYAVRRADELRSGWKGLIKPLLPLGAAVTLLMLEPDFGSSVVILTVGFVILFLAGARWRDLLAIGAAAVAVMIALLYQAPYRVKRMMSFQDPWAEPFDSGFQLTQSLMAIGSGELFGVGMGNSVQKQLYLPEMHTDFIFAVYAEEFGLLGVLILLLLFAALFRAGMRVAQAAHEQGQLFSAYLAYGISIWLCLQALLNMGVNMGALPTKGLPLPLISYGGSSLVMSCIALGLLLRIALEVRQFEAGQRSARSLRERG